MRTGIINNTITHLLNFEKYSNFKQALEEAAIANQFQLCLLSEDFNPLVTVETRHMVPLDDAIRIGHDLARTSGDSYRFLDIRGAKTYWGSIDFKNSRYYLMIVDNEDMYSQDEINMIAEIIELSMGMWKYTPQRDAKAEFIHALVRGNKSLAFSLIDEAEIRENDIMSVFYVKGLKAGQASENFERAQSRGRIKVTYTTSDDEIYGLILSAGSNESEKMTQTAQDRETITEIDECIRLFDCIKENKAVRSFHVTGVDGIDGAGDGFRLINETWSFVESVFPYKRVFSKYEMVLVSNCIEIQLAGGQLKKNYFDLLEPFRKEGSNKARQLLETLETFVLDAGMNAAKTSQFLNVHTNTVQYRLRKINEILGVEITGNRVIPGLTVALALRRLETEKNGKTIRP